MKPCSTCHKRFPEDGFPLRGDGSRRKNCRECNRSYWRAYYKRNPNGFKARRKRNRVTLRKLIQEAKNKPCADCKVKYPYWVMAFDHLEGTKKTQEVSRFISRGATVMALAEVKKCEVVCSNCHAHRTYLRAKKNGMVPSV